MRLKPFKPQSKQWLLFLGWTNEIHESLDAQTRHWPFLPRSVNVSISGIHSASAAYNIMGLVRARP